MNNKYVKVLEIFEKNLRNKNYSDNTIILYISYVKKFLYTINKDAYNLTTKELLTYLLTYKYSSISQQNQIISSVKLYYKYILNKHDIHLNKIERPKKERHLPRIIDSDDLNNKLNNISNKKHQAILSLAFATGMRVSEVCNLKMKNIDSKRMLIFIENGKFKKDRYVPFSKNILQLLRIYWKEYKTKEKYSTKSCEKIFYKLKNNIFIWKTRKNRLKNNLKKQLNYLKIYKSLVMMKNKKC